MSESSPSYSTLISPETAKPSTTGKVLVAEDDPLYCLVLQRLLRSWHYQVVVATDGDQAWDVLQKEYPPQILLFDWMMPGIEGPELCRRVRKQARLPYPYILLLTAKSQKDDIVSALDAGADDFLTKPCEVAELRARLGVGKRIMELQEELMRTQEELRYGATHDALTSVWNRSALLELLKRDLDRQSRSALPVGVLMIDIDHFKKVNDTYGHLVGDQVICDVVKRITRSVRGYDIVGRYGGEEFVVVLSDIKSTMIEQRADAIRRAVCESPIRAGGRLIPITVSVGVAVSNSKRGNTDRLLAAADAALYEAKRNGRNRIETSPPVQ